MAQGARGRGTLDLSQHGKGRRDVQYLAEALAELYQRTRTAVYGLALSYLRNAHDAQDLTQDVYVQAVSYTHLDVYKRQSKMSLISLFISNLQIQ